MILLAGWVPLNNVRYHDGHLKSLEEDTEKLDE
jgi:hypothetical protein